MKLRYAFLVPLFMLGQIAAVAAHDTVKLFKIVSPKDEVVVGLTADELHQFGAGPELDNFMKHLAEAGQMTIWQYAVRKDQSGNLQQAPLKRIAIFKSDMLRIEPYATPLQIVAPEK
jgi:hypothetical protein